MTSDKKRPLVSVVMITYRHERFIRDAIEGVLMQEYTGEIELIIANDKSPDDTKVVVRDIIKNHPNGHWIKYKEHMTNLGMMPNFLWALEEAKGEYIAICEGDDYWTDPYKLQKQVDFLETHPTYNMTVSRYKFYYENSGVFKENKELFNVNQELTVKNFIAFNFSHTSTYCFRNNITYPAWFTNVFAGDQSLCILATGNGKIKYFSEFFSIYRVNDGSVTNNVDPTLSLQRILQFLDYVNQYTQQRYNLLIKHRKFLSHIYYYFEKSKSKMARRFLSVILYGIRWFGVRVLVKITH